MKSEKLTSGLGVLLVGNRAISGGLNKAVSARLALTLILFAGTAGAEDPATAAAADVRFEFDSSLPAGIERKRFLNDIRVRGWQVADRVYFGQARVGDEWGVGFVFENGNTVYGLNNRGIQVTRQF